MVACVWLLSVSIPSEELYMSKLQNEGPLNDIKYLQNELSNENVRYDLAYGKTHSKCGVGTVFEPETYSCILKDVINPEEWCGPGTYYNATEHSCLLKKTIDPKFNEHHVWINSSFIFFNLD